jgi:hypothetical protein
MENIPEKYRHDLAIIRDTAKQIVRDLNVDFEFFFSGNEQMAFEELKTQLKPLVEKIYKGDRHSFSLLLYRIDINEKDYKKAISESNVSSFEERIAELIIRREFQKVLTKKYFSDR